MLVGDYSDIFVDPRQGRQSNHRSRRTVKAGEKIQITRGSGRVIITERRSGSFSSRPWWLSRRYLDEI